MPTRLHVTEKSESKAGINIMETDWKGICDFKWSSTNSLESREHCWKNIIRFFKTSLQVKYMESKSVSRQCGKLEANHYHMFWVCLRLYQHCSGIYRMLTSVFKAQIPFDI